MQDVIIDIKGTQTVDGEDDVVSVTTVGQLEVINGKTYLRYEDSAATGMEGVNCLIKIDHDDNSVVMSRSGALSTRMYIKKGQRHMCHYQTAQGTITMGIFGESVKENIGADGGELFMSYTLDVNYGMVSRNRVEINVKRA